MSSSLRGIGSTSITFRPENTKSNTFYACKPADITEVFNYINSISLQGIWENIFWNKPQDYITSIRVYPFDFSTMNPGGCMADTSIKLGRWECDLTNSTGCYRLLPGYQYKFNLGTHTFTPHFNNFLDCTPYTKYELYLPYCGFVNLDATEYTGKTISIDYIVDYSTGGCTAVVTDITNSNAPTILFTRKGLMGVALTWSSTNAAQMLRDSVSTIGGAGAMALGGLIGGKIGAAAAKKAYNKAEGAVNNTYEKKYDEFQEQAARMREKGLNPDMADQVAVRRFENWAENYGPESPKYPTLEQRNPFLTSNIISSATNGITNAFLNAPIGVDRGEIGGDFSMFSMPQNPYLVITRTHTTLPTNYQTLMGKPSGKTATLSTVTGYAEIDAVRVEGITSSNGVSPTAEELTTIASALHSGVIL